MNIVLLQKSQESRVDNYIAFRKNYDGNMA